jgi:hypothetical protein
MAASYTLRLRADLALSVGSAHDEAKVITYLFVIYAALQPHECLVFSELSRVEKRY